MDANSWNQKYQATDRLWSATPNQFVAAELADLEPGRAIDLAAGEGRNAVWLAERGWKVTAVDFSDVAIDRGRVAAAERNLEIDWQVGDVHHLELEPKSYDLVVLAYLQLPWPEMERILPRAAAAVAPGGTLLLIAHDSKNLEHGHGGPQTEVVLYTPEQVVGVLGELHIDRAETVDRVVDTPEGQKVALDCLVRAHAV